MSPGEESRPGPEESPSEEGLRVEDRWWVDTGGQRDRRGAAPPERPRPIVGERLFSVGKDYDQERALAHLVEDNLQLIRGADPPAGSWGYVALTEERSPPERIEKARRRLRLPKWARGVLVDSGVSIRAIATGTPEGERIVELRLGPSASLDAWAGGEWVRERVFRGRDRALREGGRLLVRYLRRR